jgi:hypothetical protein
MALTITVTNAGRAALVNAANTGTAAVTIAQVGVSGVAVAPSTTAITLPGESKRIATLSGDVVADDTIHMIVRDEGTSVYTVRSFALYLADGTLFAIYGQADPILEKSSQAIMLLAIDVQFADVAAAQLTFGDTNFLNPPATTETIGVVELATLAETIAGLDTSRVPAARMVKDAVASWLDARFGANNAGIWHPGNDGAGSGLDADLLDGQQSSFYLNIPARLGYTPIQQGTGNAQLPNIVKIGWSAATRLKATVDATDLGNIVFDAHISDVWRAANDGAGSGLDADLLDGQDGSYYTNIPARLGYQPVNRAGDTFGGTVTVPALRVVGGAGQNGLSGGNGDAATYSVFNMALDVWYGLGLRTFDGSVNGVYDARLGRWDVKTGYRINGVDVWHPGNDGAGSGLDADLFQGRDPSYYTAIPARLGFQPVQQGTGVGQLAANVIRIGWGSNSRVRVTVDNTDAGNVVFDGHIADVWRSSNDGSGSGLDADLLDGHDSTYYTNVAGHLGFTPVRQGGGVNQLSNVIKIGWSGTRVLATVDATDQGPIVFDTHIANVWRSTNDGSGSGLDADLLDGVQGANFARTDLTGGVAFAGGVTAPYLGSSGDIIAAGTVTGAAVRIASGAQINGFLGGVGDGASFTNYNLTLAVHWGLGLRTYDGSVNGVYDAREGRWNVRASYQVNGINVWHGGNDGSGSGLDADLLDGSDGSFYANIPARLGFWPVRQGGGANQTTNTVYIGWSSGSRLRAQVDSTDLGPIVFDGHIADVWRSANDGSGSGLDADLLDGLEGAAYLRDIGSNLEQTGYLKLSNGLILQWGWVANLTNRANNTITFPIAFPSGALAMWPSLGTGIGIGDSNFSIGAQPLSTTQGRIAIATSSGGTIGCYWYALGK